MNENLPRWIFQSVAKHFQTVAAGIPLTYFVEGIDERDESAMHTDHVELRVTGPRNKELSKDYYLTHVSINFMFTKMMDQIGSAFDIIQWAGIFAAAMLEPIPIYKYGTGPDDTEALIGCLRAAKDKPREVRIYHFGQIRPDIRVRQSEVDAEFSFEFSGET